MTRGSEPTDSQSPESLGADSERRRWVHKRAQFDSAINSARLLGVVQSLSNGVMRAEDALRIILDVNGSNDQARYVAEMLAMKKEFRDLARLEYHPEIAKFIIEGSRLVPSLTAGLSSQMLMAMGHAGQNDAYLETVSSAVSALLSDLDKPLMPDARNYLRLLWDQMEATRRLKQTEALYTGQRASLAPDRARSQEQQSGSGSFAAADASPAHPAEDRKLATTPAAPAASSVDTVASSPTRTMLGLGQSPQVPSRSAAASEPVERKLWREADEERKTEGTSARFADATGPTSRDSRRIVSKGFADAPVPSPKGKREIRWKVADDDAPAQNRVAASPSKLGEPGELSALEAKALGLPAAGLALEPLLSQHEQEFFAGGEDEPDEPTTQMDANVAAQVQTPNRAATDTIVDTQPFGARESGPPLLRQEESKREELKVPTSGVPKWAVASVMAVALAGVGLVVALTSEPKNEPDAPKPNASGAQVAPSGSGTARAPSIPSARRKRPNAHPTAAGVPSPLAPPPPSERESESAPTPPSHRAVPKAQGSVSAPVQQSRPQPVTPAAPAPVRNAAPAKAPATLPKNRPEPVAEPAPKAVTVVTPPEVAKTLSPVDRIVAELRLISPDPVGIEDKARELARIIARSKRKEATRIIEDLGPSVAVDPLGRDPTLEDSLQNFAISVLGRVATDDDDNRAVDALLLLGEWVKNGGKGKQKALSALQTLSRESIVKTSAPRLRALKTAQAQAD